MNLLFVSLAPVFIILLYVYFRDKYEKEPLSMVLKALLVGAILPLPVVFVEKFLALPAQNMPSVFSVAWLSFVVAGLTEEGFKFLAFFLIIWKNTNFNEKFDGIVYAVFIAMGFAGIENILYVSQGGFNVAVTRAFTAVPAHALFGIIMGYHLGLAKFYPAERNRQIFLALFYPVLFHGFYDFSLMSQNQLLLLLFVPYIVWLWIRASRRMNQLSQASFYRTGFLKDDK